MLHTANVSLNPPMACVLPVLTGAPAIPWQSGVFHSGTHTIQDGFVLQTAPASIGIRDGGCGKPLAVRIYAASTGGNDRNAGLANVGSVVVPAIWRGDRHRADAVYCSAGSSTRPSADGGIGGAGAPSAPADGGRSKSGGSRMDNPFSLIRIDENRFRRRFDALAELGATPDGGVNRPAFSDAHLSARQWFLEEARRAELDTKTDGAGNQSAILHCGPSNGVALLLGSHLDSVPYGGRFDGALGVVSALEVLQTIKDHDVSLKFNLEAIAFIDEEGHFIDIFGSQAVAGTIKAGHIRNACSNKDFREALLKTDLSEESILSARRDTSTIAGYIELHIEQGRRLADQGITIGVITSIVGIRTFKIKFIGRADHAGTTPMDKRQDAALGASSFALAVKRIVAKKYPHAVATVGNMVFEPGASNVIPQIVTISLEFRSGIEDELDSMQRTFLEQASREAKKFRLSVEAENVGFVVPASMDEKFQSAIADASTILGLTHTTISSGAGHDAQSMAKICPAGMIFVPSVDGFSHSAREFTNWQDCVSGANVLLHTVLNLNETSST